MSLLGTFYMTYTFASCNMATVHCIKQQNGCHFWVILLPARRYASAGYRDRNVSVRPSVRHAPVLCQNEES